jgi:hypothetical protein
MIKQRLNQASRALLREFWAKDSLSDCQPMSEIDDNRDEIIRLQSRSDIRRSQEVSDKLTSVTKLLPVHLNEAFSDTLASKSADLEFSTKHDPIVVRHQVGNGIPHLSQPLLAGRLSLQQSPEDIQVARLLFSDYCNKQIVLTVEVGIQSAPRITGIFGDLLRHSSAKPVTQKVAASHGD